MEPRVDPRPAQLAEGRDSRRAGERVTRQGAREGRVVERALSRGVGGGHDVGAARDGRQREAAGQRLAEDGQVGDDAVVLLGAAVGEPEAGHHLVEDEEGAQAIGELTEAGEEPGLRPDGPLERLDDDRGQVGAARRRCARSSRDR